MILMRFIVIAVLVLVALLMYWVMVTDIMKKNVTTPITIACMGDVMLGRMVNEMLKIKGCDYPFSLAVQNIIKTADIALVNQEFAFTLNTYAVPKVFNFKSDPEHVACLKQAGITVVNLANNHVLDFGIDGMIDTLNTLDQAGIGHVGAGIDSIQAQTPIIIEVKNKKIGIIGCTDNEPSWQAGRAKPGIFYVSTQSPKELLQVIATVRSQVDYLIVTMHWGPNMVLRPMSGFVEFAHSLVDHGVDLFHGHSAHVVQGVERYKGKVILYDTGDFVDDYAVDEMMRNDISMLFLIKIMHDQEIKVEHIPVIIRNMRVDLADEQEAQFIVKRTELLSQELL